MRNKKAKALKRVAVAFCTQMGKPHEAKKEYKTMKKLYKQSKGEI